MCQSRTLSRESLNPAWRVVDQDGDKKWSGYAKRGNLGWFLAKLAEPSAVLVT
jgi:hypothetical protein